MQVPPPKTVDEVRDMFGRKLAMMDAGGIKCAGTMAYVAQIFLKAVEAGEFERRLAALEAARDAG